MCYVLCTRSFTDDYETEGYSDFVLFNSESLDFALSGLRIILPHSIFGQGLIMMAFVLLSLWNQIVQMVHSLIKVTASSMQHLKCSSLKREKVSIQTVHFIKSFSVLKLYNER